MGGLGSSRWSTHIKAVTVEDCLDLDVCHWTREGILGSEIVRSGSQFWNSESNERGASLEYELDLRGNHAPCVRLFYTLVSTNERMDYRVTLCKTYPHLGGVRWWFVCPLVINNRPCKNRVRKLYIPPGCRYFGCRRCYRLTYRSAQERDARDDWSWDRVEALLF